MAKREQQERRAGGSGAGSRSRTIERREQKVKQRRRRNQMIALAVVVAVVVIAIIGLILGNLPAEAPIPTETAERYADIPVSTSPEGYPQMGDPNAPVRVIEYSSFDCPSCLAFHENVIPQVVEQVRQGNVLFTFAPIYGTGSVPNGQGAARAALCAGEQEMFWQFHDALFSWQSLYGNQAFQNQRLQTGIDNLGIDRGEWNACIGSGRPDTVLTSARNQLQLVGNVATPTVTVNGQLVEATGPSVQAAIAQALATAPIRPIEVTPETPEVEDSDDVGVETDETAEEAEAVESDSESEPTDETAETAGTAEDVAAEATEEAE